VKDREGEGEGEGEREGERGGVGEREGEKRKGAREREGERGKGERETQGNRKIGQGRRYMYTKMHQDRGLHDSGGSFEQNSGRGCCLKCHCRAQRHGMAARLSQRHSGSWGEAIR